MSVSLVITSCNRRELLYNTLVSFFKYNTYPLEHIIIIDDSGVENCIDNCLELIDTNIKTTIIYNEQNIGQIKSIDKAYSYVSTEYIFHCEDDWEFYDTGFIEKSLFILQKNEKIICVWLREYSNFVVVQNGHDVLPKIIDNTFRIMNPNFQERNNIWMGFTFNPGLRRNKDYIILKPYEQYMNDSKYGGSTELKLSGIYKSMGYYAAITTNEKGYVMHTGWDVPIR